MTDTQEMRRERNRRYYEKQKAKKEASRSARISDMVLARSRQKTGGEVPNIFAPAVPPKSVGPVMAADSAFTETMGWALGGLTQATGVTGFLGYPVLAELAQRPEYRRISEIIAMEMTRRWVKLKADGDDDKSDKIKAIETAMDRLHVRDVFREAVEQDGFFGRGHIFLDFGATDDRDELRQSMGDGHGNLSKLKTPKGGLRRLRSVEAVWCYPSDYNASDPLKPDWFKPSVWFVQGKEVHATRLLTIIGREVSDLLKPAYSFGGLSLSQMAKPYVDNWLRTRQSVADLISSFSVFVLKTNLAEKLTMDPNGEELFKRADFFNNLRDNRGLMLTDKELEDFANVSTSLATLDALQAQTQEHMASVSGIPLVKLLGIQPAGLNASSEGELECFYTWINALQESMLTEPLRTVLGFVQLSLFGEVDPAITFAWEPLKQVTEMEAATIRKTNAETGQVLIAGRVITPEEERQRIASDDDSIYDSIDVAAAPGEKLTPVEKATVAAGLTGAIVQAESSGLVDTPIAMEELRKLGMATGVWTSITEQDVFDAKLAPEPPEPDMFGGQPAPGRESPPEAPAPGGGEQEPNPPVAAQDAGWDEDEHPRDEDGKFSSGSGRGGNGEYADLKPSDVYFKLSDAEDTGGVSRLKEVAQKIAQERPDLAESVIIEASDLGYPNIGVSIEEAPKNPHHADKNADKNDDDTIDQPWVPSERWNDGVPSKEEAAAALDNDVVPNGWAIHGRNGSDSLSTGYVTQMSYSTDVARQYSGKNGSIWYLKPNDDAKVLDFTSTGSDDMMSLRDEFMKSFKDGDFPDQESLPKDKEEAWEEVSKNFAPENIVNSAAAYDNDKWVEWLLGATNASGVVTPDGAVAMDLDQYKKVRAA